MTAPVLDIGSWDLNIGGLIAAYRGWVIRGAASGFGYSARRRNASGRPRGPALTGATLDELAAAIENYERAR